MGIIETLSVIGGIVTGIAAIVGTLVWVFKKTPDSVNQEIDRQTLEDKRRAKETGRPV